jgi:hypothetical protein
MLNERLGPDTGSERPGGGERVGQVVYLRIAAQAAGDRAQPVLEVPQPGDELANQDSLRWVIALLTSG